MDSVQSPATAAAAVLAVYGYDIEKINVYQDRFIVGRTQATLLLGDLESCRLSEIPWESDLSEKFYFEHEKVRSGAAASQTRTCFWLMALMLGNLMMLLMFLAACSVIHMPALMLRCSAQLQHIAQ
jgi:hypothetical protein